MAFASKERARAYYAAYRASHQEQRRLSSAVYNASHKEEARAYRSAHKEQIRAYQAAYRDLHRDDNYEYHDTRAAEMGLMKSGPCMDCGGSFPYECMDWDHRPGEQKIGIVSQMTTAAAAAEIEKCDLVCANCHRTRTRTRRLQARVAKNVMSK